MSSKTLKGRKRGERRRNRVADDRGNCFEINRLSGGSRLIVYRYPDRCNIGSHVVGSIPKGMRPTKALRNIIERAFMVGINAANTLEDSMMGKLYNRIFISPRKNQGLHWKN